MKRKNLSHFSYILLCLVLWQNLLFAQIPTVEKKPAETLPDEVDLIHSGDLIDVDIIGSLEYDWRGSLNPEGFLDGIDFIESPVYALCRSETEIAEEIAKAYSKILREPKVVVRILDRSNRPLSIISGAVKIPQRLQIKRPVLLNELIIISGGLTENVSGDVQIFRPPSLNCRKRNAEKNASINKDNENNQKDAVDQSSDSNFLNIKLSDLLAGKKEANPQILSGDIITVREAEPIYVIGGVANPKQISSRAQITLSRAIASAGGLAKNADARKITIYRRENGETRIIEADLEEIKAEKVSDITLKAFDIIEVAQAGRSKSQFAPIITLGRANDKNFPNLPLRIIE